MWANIDGERAWDALDGTCHVWMCGTVHTVQYPNAVANSNQRTNDSSIKVVCASCDFVPDSVRSGRHHTHRRSTPCRVVLLPCAVNRRC